MILGRLRAAAGPDTTIAVMTYYNPLGACRLAALAPDNQATPTSRPPSPPSSTWTTSPAPQGAGDLTGRGLLSGICAGAGSAPAALCRRRPPASSTGPDPSATEGVLQLLQRQPQIAPPLLGMALPCEPRVSGRLTEPLLRPTGHRPRPASDPLARSHRGLLASTPQPYPSRRLACGVADGSRAQRGPSVPRAVRHVRAFGSVDLRPGLRVGARCGSIDRTGVRRRELMTRETLPGRPSSSRTGGVHAIRSTHAFDGESFRSSGATVLIEDGLIIGVESLRLPAPRSVSGDQL